MWRAADDHGALGMRPLLLQEAAEIFGDVGQLLQMFHTKGREAGAIPEDDDLEILPGGWGFHVAAKRV